MENIKNLFLSLIFTSTICFVFYLMASFVAWDFIDISKHLHLFRFLFMMLFIGIFIGISQEDE